MPTDFKEIANRSFRPTSPKQRLNDRQRSEAAALKEVDEQRQVQRQKTERLRKARLAAE